MGTVALGLIVLICVYAILIFFLARKNPFHTLSKMRDAQLLAFSTASSAAVMPLTMKTADEKLKVKPAVSNFLIPVGATVNMDGTALNQAVALIFLTQVYGIPLELSDLLIITFTIVAASVGTPSIPGGGMIILGTIVSNFGVPASGIVILIGVDRILGMLRTAVNVTGDLTACTVFDKIGNFEAQGNVVNEKEEVQATQKA
jgi:Na+/H+-dicarboxylate symporter